MCVCVCACVRVCACTRGRRAIFQRLWRVHAQRFTSCLGLSVILCVQIFNGSKRTKYVPEASGLKYRLLSRV